MSKLTDFYTHKASLQEEGKPIDPQWELLEDQLLKEELLPELIEQLKTVLSKVKSPLMFSGSYDPNGCLSVSFSRCCAQISVLSLSSSTKKQENKPFEEQDASPLVDEKKTQGKVATQPNSVTTPTSAIIITSQNIQEVTGRDMRITVNGKVFQEKNAIQTFIEALKYIGLENVAKVGIYCNGYNLVDSNERTDGEKKWQQQEGNKWVYVYFSNITKVNYLMQIAEFLKLNIKIEAI